MMCAHPAHHAGLRGLRAPLEEAGHFLVDSGDHNAQSNPDDRTEQAVA
jgi:hypothetical protein